MKNFLKNKNIKLTPYTPDNTIASFIELPNGINPIEAIWHTSSIALDTDKICFIYSLADDGIYFIAAPALSFLKHPNSNTPLSSSLPGNEFHKGNGAYISPIGNNLFSIIIKEHQKLTSYIGDKASVLQFAQEHPQFWTDNGNIPWLSLNQYYQKETLKLVTALSVSSFILIVILLFLNFIFQYKSEQFSSVIKDKQMKILQLEEKNLLIMNINSQNNSNNKILHKYLEISNYVINQSGRIISYEYKNNHIKYSVELPQNTNNLGFFGTDAITVIKNNIIIIQKEENL